MNCIFRLYAVSLKNELLSSNIPTAGGREPNFSLYKRQITLNRFRFTPDAVKFPTASMSPSNHANTIMGLFISKDVIDIPSPSPTIYLMFPIAGSRHAYRHSYNRDIKRPANVRPHEDAQRHAPLCQKQVHNAFQGHSNNARTPPPDSPSNSRCVVVGSAGPDGFPSLYVHFND